jgi:hypothetical protein
MSNNKNEKNRLLDNLNENSLNVFKKFGYVYKDRNTNKIKIRVYNNK